MYNVSLTKGRTRKIEARPLRTHIDARTPRYWMGGDPFETHLLNALSLTFPAGERFFMRSVRALRDVVKDPALEEQVRGFLAQESLHSREHSALNEWLGKLGFPAAAIEKRIEERIAERSARRGKRDDLAVTCALEHFTAIMARKFLNDRGLQARCHESVRPLWLWHAIEELDHKAVAFDVYEAAGGEYRRRVIAMVAATFGLMGTAMIIQWHLMKRDGEHLNLRSWLRGAMRYYGPAGFLVDVLPDYLQYYRRDFHPWQDDDQELIERAERELNAMLQRSELN
jgi:predicted metal-dependent hydrolase